MSKKKQQKLNAKDSTGLLNVSASVMALVTLFGRIFLEPTLEGLVFTGPFLIAFAICAYFARARFLGYKFSDRMNSFMVGMPIVVILLSIWGIAAVL